MRIISPYTEIYGNPNGMMAWGCLRRIEMAARTCYKSEDMITDGSAEKLIRGCINSGHESILEHASVTVKFVCDRGISHELVRHRLAAFSQESTRYCNYKSEKFGSDVTFIRPCYLDEDSEGYRIWCDQMLSAEEAYFNLLDFGCSPQEARSVLPNSLKTEVVMTADLREWRHFFEVRALETTGRPHPQMLQLTIPLLDKFKKLIPVVFDDLEVKANHDSNSTM